MANAPRLISWIAHDRGYGPYRHFQLYCQHDGDAVSRPSTHPAANQVEFHPFLNTQKLQDAAARLSIPPTAHCAVARASWPHHPVDDIGARHGKTGAQAGLRWTLQKGVAINAMSTRAENLQPNFDIGDFRLDDDEMARIDQLMTKVGLSIPALCRQPHNGPARRAVLSDSSKLAARPESQRHRSDWWSTGGQNDLVGPL